MNCFSTVVDQDVSKAEGEDSNIESDDEVGASFCFVFDSSLYNKFSMQL